MRFGFLCAAIALAGAASSSLAQVQLPIPAFNRTFTGSLTRGFWFQAPTTFVVTGLRVPDEASRGLQVVEFIDFGTTPPPAFSQTVVGTQMFYSNGQPSSQILSTAITCVQGNFYGVLGACGDSTSVSNSYGPTGAFNTTLFGQPITLTRMGTQFNIAATGGNNPCWSEAAFEPSRVEVYCAPPTGFATSRKFGDGCVRNAGTVHEFFATAGANDLNGASVSMIYNGSNGYLVLPGINPFVAPTPAATQLVLGDDAETSVTLAGALPYPGGSTTSLTVCSNGFISTGSGNGTAFTPSEAAFLNFTQTVWSNWHDYNPAAGGAVRFEEVGNLSIVTWDGVVDFGQTTPNTFQFQFDRSSGNVDIVFQSISGLGNAYLVGFKCGGPVLPVTSVDLSALLPSTFQTGCDTLPLDFDSSARPVLGTSINLVTTRIPAGASVTIHRLTFGSQVPPLDLTPLGAPGCFAHVNPLGPSNIFLVGSPSTTSSLALPNNPALAGTTLFGQAASLVPGVNALSIITSNGLELVADIN